MVFNLNDFGLWFELPTELNELFWCGWSTISHHLRGVVCRQTGSLQFLGIHSQPSWLPSVNCWVPMSVERLLAIDGRHTPW